jgi:predicted outer membrane repeat protein
VDPEEEELMFKRNLLQFVAMLSLFAVGSTAIKLVGETVPMNSQTFWETLAALPAEAAGTTIYVDASASGTGTGASWTDAYTKLQDALTTAVSGDQIWVAAGVYYPDEGVGMTNDDRTTTFTLLDGVEVYGGFAGGETSLGQRDWDANVTVLSGDIDQNDTADPNGVVTDVADIAGSNAYHVVTDEVPNISPVLDGFTITAGDAGGSYPDERGGGIYNQYGNPMLVNLILSGNRADLGAGMHIANNTPALLKVTLTNNQATFGGGMYITSGTSPTLTDVIFTGNLATNSGGGVYVGYSAPVFINTLFTGNRAGFYGGGMYNTIAFPDLVNATFSGNYADSRGGGMINSASDPVMTNVILWNNRAQWEGDQILNWSGSNPSISYSDIQGSGGSGAGWDTALGTDGGNNIDVEPLFVTLVDPLTAPTTAGDLHLQVGSPAVDVGDNSACPATDLDGNIRPIDGDKDGVADCDMGAYEKLIDLFLPLILR